MAHSLVALLLAEGASIDTLSGRLTAFNMLEGVSAATFPAVLPRLFVITIYEADRAADDPDVFERVLFETPQGQRTEVSKAKLGFEPGVPAHRSIHLLAVKLEEAGRYRVHVELSDTADGNWRPALTRTLVVTETPQPSVAADPTADERH